MRDFLPEEVQTRADMIQRIRAVYQRYGYSEIETVTCTAWLGQSVV